MKAGLVHLSNLSFSGVEVWGFAVHYCSGWTCAFDLCFVVRLLAKVEDDVGVGKTMGVGPREIKVAAVLQKLKDAVVVPPLVAWLCVCDFVFFKVRLG